ncbi:hypothetical protein CR513_50083, partial [Mucuna pruriens]
MGKKKARPNVLQTRPAGGNSRPKPLIIYYNSPPQPRVPFMVSVPAKPVYNNNAVPWRYPLEENKDLASERKDKAVEWPRKIVMEGEATEFLKLIHHSEYKILDQMHKTLARVLHLSLLINSEGHCNLLFKVLNDAHVAQDIIPEKFMGIINNITTSRNLSFSEDEVPIEGRSHNQLLHIMVKYGNYMIARVLIDNGSSLNILPKATLEKLYSIGSTLRTSSVVVRAFDGSKQEVMGEIILPIHIGPTTFVITFQVIDIQPAYSCFLGRPWIHTVGQYLPPYTKKSNS